MQDNLYSDFWDACGYFVLCLFIPIVQCVLSFWKEEYAFLLNVFVLLFTVLYDIKSRKEKPSSVKRKVKINVMVATCWILIIFSLLFTILAFNNIYIYQYKAWALVYLLMVVPLFLCVKDWIKLGNKEEE